MLLAYDVRSFFTGDAVGARDTHPWALDETCLSLTAGICGNCQTKPCKPIAAEQFQFGDLGAACPAGRQRKHRART